MASRPAKPMVQGSACVRQPICAVESVCWQVVPPPLATMLMCVRKNPPVTSRWVVAGLVGKLVGSEGTVNPSFSNLPVESLTHRL